MSTSSRITLLLDAVIQGKLTKLMDYVCPQNVNYVDPRYRLSLLMWAVSLGRLPSVEFLLSQGASLFSVDSFGFGTLHRAVWCGDAAIVRTLLFLSPASRMPPPSETLLALTAEAAAAKGDGSATTENVSSSKPNASKDAPRSQSPIVYPSAAVGDTATEVHVFTAWLAMEQDKVKPTIYSPEPTGEKLQWRSGAQRLVNMVHPLTGRTPLMLAAVRGDGPIVDFLINTCHADMYAVDKEGLTAADLAALCGHIHVLHLFLASAPGDGSGRSFQQIQQRAEDYCEVAKTIPQRNRLFEMNKLLCVDIIPQSSVSAK